MKAPSKMKRRYLILLILIGLQQLSQPVSALQQIRARPVLKGDKEYNAILLHVAQYFVLTIPDGRTVGDIDAAVRCTFVIAPDGALRQLEIENETDGWTGFFEGKSRTEMWLRDAVLEGMRRIPAFDMSRIRASKSAKKRTVVFSFGRPGTSTDIPSMGFHQESVDANTRQSISEQQQAIRDGKAVSEQPRYGMTRPEAERRYRNQTPAWAGFTDENIRSTMRPKYEPDRQSLPVLRPSHPRPPRRDSLPPLEVAVTLQ